MKKNSVVFGGFAAQELANRISDARPKVIVSASCGIEVGRVIPYKPLLDRAMFEQEVQDPGTLEQQISKVRGNKDFHAWSQQVSGLLKESSKRELFRVIGSRD